MKLFWEGAGAAILLWVASPGSAAPLEDWREELPRIVAAIRSTHPDPFTRIGEREFMRRAAALQAALPSLSEEQRVIETMRLVAAIGEGHSWIEPGGEVASSWFPIRLYEFTDGVFVTSAHRSVEELAGAQVLEIAGLPVQAALARTRELLGADNAFGALENLHAVSSAGVMRGLGLTDTIGRLPLKIRARDGRVRNLALAPMAGQATFDWKYRSEPFGVRVGETKDWVSAFGGLPATAFRDVFDPARPPHLRNRSYYHGEELTGRNAFYIQVNFVSDNPDEPFIPFFQRVLVEVDRLRPRRLIVDWRYNSGGDGSKITAMIHEFIKREDNPPWRELYVLTGRKTFSAAVAAIDAFRDHVPATFVGEPPGSALNAFGDAVAIRFPKTGLVLHVSTSWHSLTNAWETDLDDPHVPIDVPAPFSFADYVAGRDPAVDPILRGEEMRSIPIIIATDGVAAARRVYEERKRRYGRYAWWKAADRLAMSRAFYKLKVQRRLDDALEVARMNTQIHPDLWNSWGNLGEAYLALGRRPEAIAAYRRSIDIAPHNEAVRSSGLEELQ